MILSIWYWTTLIGWILVPPLVLFPLGGGPLLSFCVMSTATYVTYDWFTQKYPNPPTFKAWLNS